MNTRPTWLPSSDAGTRLPGGEHNQYPYNLTQSTWGCTTSKSLESWGISDTANGSIHHSFASLLHRVPPTVNWPTVRPSSTICNPHGSAPLKTQGNFQKKSNSTSRNGLCWANTTNSMSCPHSHPSADEVASSLLAVLQSSEPSCMQLHLITAAATSAAVNVSNTLNLR